MNKEELWYWLTNIRDLYQESIKRLINVFLDPEEIYKASEDELLASGAVSAEKAHTIVQSKNNFRSMYKLEKMKRDGIRFVYYGSEEYPEAFLALPDKPWSLYVKGNLPDPDLPSAGIVGARTCSGYGKEMTLKFSQMLAANQVQIISGMAQGVDSFASRGALEVGGKTFVILGCGVDVIYPSQNVELYYQILLKGGGIISEYPPGTQPLGWHFPHRNRLISALSDKLLVMEARKRSGTLTTVSYALAQGKDVYALPGRVTDPLSESCNILISEGAGILLDPGDLLEEYFGDARNFPKAKARDESLAEARNFPKAKIRDESLAETRFPKAKAQAVSSAENPSTESREEENGRVLRVLGYEPKTIDEIAGECGMSAVQAAFVLADLELGGMCSQICAGYYCRV